MTAPDLRAEVRAQISEGAVFDTSYVLMNVLATIVACYGLLENSAAVVIGAMLIAQLLGPIGGIGLALVTGDNLLLRRAILAEMGGVFLVLLVSLLIGRIHHDLPLGSQVMSRTEPNLLDLIIALAGGTAGAYATISPKLRSGLVGVAIATALVPPLSVCGLCLARGETRLAWGGFLLFFANLVAIQLAFSVVLAVHGLHRAADGAATPGPRVLMRHVLSLVLLAALAVVLGGNLTRTVEREQEQAAVRAAIQAGLKAYPGAELANLQFHETGQTLTVTAVVRASGAVSPAKVSALQSRLPAPKGQTLRLLVRSVITKTATAQGYVEQSHDAGAPGDSSADDDGPQIPGANE